jgi:hypothetical protein
MGIQVVAMAFLADHYHLLVWVEDTRQLSRLMNYFNSKLAREIGRLTGWKQKVWSRRYQAIVISQEEEAQVDRLTYVLSNGVKEGLVEKVLDWPGLHAAPALLSGLPLKGVWYDRTKEYLVKIKGKKTDPDRFAETETLTLVPLPCWMHLSPKAYRARIASLIPSPAGAIVARGLPGSYREAHLPDRSRRRGPARGHWPQSPRSRGHPTAGS